MVMHSHIKVIPIITLLWVLLYGPYLLTILLIISPIQLGLIFIRALPSICHGEKQEEAGAVTVHVNNDCLNNFF